MLQAKVLLHESKEYFTLKACSIHGLEDRVPRKCGINALHCSAPHIIGHDIQIPIIFTLSAQSWDLFSPEVEGTKPPGNHVTPFGISATVRFLRARSTAPRSASGSRQSATRNAGRTQRKSDNPPRLRAFRRGEIHMLRRAGWLERREGH